MLATHRGFERSRTTRRLSVEERRARHAVTRDRVETMLGALVPGIVGIAIFAAIVWTLWSKW